MGTEVHGRRRSCNSSSFNKKDWCPGWESNPHEEKSPEDFKSRAPLSLALLCQAFTTAYPFREWLSLPVLPRPSLPNSHNSAIVYLGKRPHEHLACGSSAVT